MRSARYAERTKHAELTTAPFLMWGMSAGGQFNYEFVAWKPERVAAFVVNKGGIYYSALLSPAARSVPGILFIGGKDLEFRNHTIAGLFAVNRRAGALWALAEEPGVAHVVGRSRDLAMMFYEDVLPLRLGSPAGAALQRWTRNPGFLGDLKLHTAQATRRNAQRRTIRRHGCRRCEWHMRGKRWPRRGLSEVRV